MFLFIFISVGQDFLLAYFTRKREFDILCAGNCSNKNPGGGGGGGKGTAMSLVSSHRR